MRNEWICSIEAQMSTTSKQASTKKGFKRRSTWVHTIDSVCVFCERANYSFLFSYDEITTYHTRHYIVLHFTFIPFYVFTSFVVVVVVIIIHLVESIPRTLKIVVVRPTQRNDISIHFISFRFVSFWDLKSVLMDLFIWLLASLLIACWPLGRKCLSSIQHNFKITYLFLQPHQQHKHRILCENMLWANSLNFNIKYVQKVWKKWNILMWFRKKKHDKSIAAFSVRREKIVWICLLIRNGIGISLLLNR